MSEIRIRRLIAAPRAEVWRALTDESELADWFLPPEWEASASADARVGGRYELVSVSSQMTLHGSYAAVEPEQRLVFTWRWNDDGDETLVTISLSDADGGTEVEVLHERFRDEVSRENHVAGWTECLERLPAHLDER